jgi:hypothetical protein
MVSLPLFLEAAENFFQSYTLLPELPCDFIGQLVHYGDLRDKDR